MDKELQLQKLQSSELGLGLLKSWNIQVGVFPETEKMLVGRHRLSLISRNREHSTELQVRQCAYGIQTHDSAMIDDLRNDRNSGTSLAR